MSQNAALRSNPSTNLPKDHYYLQNAQEFATLFAKRAKTFTAKIHGNIYGVFTPFDTPGQYYLADQKTLMKFQSELSDNPHALKLIQQGLVNIKNGQTILSQMPKPD